MKLLISALGTALLALGFNPAAHALDVLSTTGSGAVGDCQPAVAGGDAFIRRRPLAVINEGSQTQFATCAYTTEEISINVVGFNTKLTNISAVPASVTCTAVVGEESQSAQYFVKSIDLAAGATGTLAWSAADNGGLLFAKSVAISCALPPFVGLNRNRVTTLISTL